MNPAGPGNDSNSGTSASSPWQHLSKVNATVFAPGDQILLAAGGAWNEQLQPKGSGTPGTYVTIDMYGSGARPVINGGGIANGAVYLLNQHDWIIQNIEVTNHAAQGNTLKLLGIQVRNDTGGLLSHITIKNVTVHDVNGIVNGFYGENAGIAVTADQNLANPNVGPNSTWSDITISGSTIYTVDRIGIYVGPRQQNTNDQSGWPSVPKTNVVTIANNTVEDAGGDGILGFIVSNLMITDNIVSNSGSRLVGACPVPGSDYCNGAAVAIWSAISDTVTFQYNEVYGFEMSNTQSPAPGDGEAFDADIGSSNSIFQYNYSHNNRNGMLLTFDNGNNNNDNGLGIDNLKVRYNISYNDHVAAFIILGPLNSGTHPANINNNTIINSITSFMFATNGATLGSAAIYNNIFEYASAPPATAYFPVASGANISFDSNIYHVASGSHPSDEPGLPGNPPDSHKLTSDPLLSGPGFPANGMFTLEGMKLLTGSPALASGSNPGLASMGDNDIWANPVAATGAPNRGAYAAAGLSVMPVPDLAFRALVTPSSSYEVAPWSIHHVTDDQTSSVTNAFGYSSRVGQSANHEESLVIDLHGRHTFDKVVLFPRNDAGNVGAGFPIDFTIQVWDGTNWLTRVTRTGCAQPGNAGQVFTWGFPDTTNLIKIDATNLRQVGSDFLLQFAEVQVVDSNQLIGATVTADSSYEADGWSTTHVTDGLRSSISGALGYSSSFANAASNHTETVSLTARAAQTYSSVVLYPRNDAGFVGGGFPTDFTISTWNGSSWDVKVTQTGYPQPGNAGQTFSFSPVTTTAIRVQASGLRQVQGSYLLQFAEIEALP